MTQPELEPQQPVRCADLSPEQSERLKQVEEIELRVARQRGELVVRKRGGCGLVKGRPAERDAPMGTGPGPVEKLFQQAGASLFPCSITIPGKESLTE